MTERRVIPVKDKRRVGKLADDASEAVESTPGVAGRTEGGQVLVEETSDTEQTPLGEIAEPQVSLDELMRLKADLENDRKRMMREQTRSLEYAARELTRRMIPVLDSLQLAIEHGEGGSGIELALKELLDVLRSEGFEAIEVNDGDPFDPVVHHALLSQPDPNVEVDTVASVQRRGYRFKDQVLRPAEVIVAQPQAAGD